MSDSWTWRLTRLTQHQIENPLDRRILDGELAPGDHVTIDVAGKVSSFRTASQPAAIA